MRLSSFTSSQPARRYGVGSGSRCRQELGGVSADSLWGRVERRVRSTGVELALGCWVKVGPRLSNETRCYPRSGISAMRDRGTARQDGSHAVGRSTRPPCPGIRARFAIVSRGDRAMALQVEPAMAGGLGTGGERSWNGFGLISAWLDSLTAFCGVHLPSCPPGWPAYPLLSTRCHLARTVVRGGTVAPCAM